MEREKIKTYVAGLDERMGSGIPKGHIVLVCGASGSMKSSFAYSIMYNYAKEKLGRGVYLSLEQNKNSLMKHMGKLGMDTESVKNDLAIIDLGWLRREIKEVTEGEEVPWKEALQHQIRSYKEKIGYDVLVIDSLDAYYVLAKMENPRNELFHFFEEMRYMGLTAFLICEMPLDRKRFGKYGVESFLADGIIHLAMERTGKSVGRFINIVKMREIKHATDYFPLLIDKSGFKIVTK